MCVAKNVYSVVRMLYKILLSPSGLCLMFPYGFSTKVECRHPILLLYHYLFPPFSFVNNNCCIYVDSPMLGG